MVVSISNIPEGSLVKRFITSGKPGNCAFCGKFVEKLEAHHTCYSPERVIKLCHLCHHKVHFWPQRLSQDEILKLLKTRFHHQTALATLKKFKDAPISLSNLIAPSKSGFLKKQSNIYDRKHILKHIHSNKDFLKKQKPLKSKSLVNTNKFTNTKLHRRG